jgi:hypothetical protein
MDGLRSVLPRNGICKRRLAAVRWPHNAYTIAELSECNHRSMLKPRIRAAAYATPDTLGSRNAYLVILPRLLQS